MPVYDLKCQKCGCVEEHLLTFSEPKPEKCQHCEGELKQVISKTNFVLVGNDWYDKRVKK